MPPKTKEDYRKDLLDNINFIQKFAPEFSMTEEQIEYMLSDEKIKMHEKYKGQNILSESKERGQIVDFYTPKYHPAFDRHAKWIVRKDDTKAS